jgi:predicted dehydrogenase
MQQKEAAFGAPALAAREEPLRIGMIGAGFIAQVAHLYAFSRISEARIVAVAEPHDGLREAASHRFAVKTSTANYRDLLCRPDIDGVVICLPRRAQSLVTEFISENQVVLSEKPTAMTLAEAEGMVPTVQRSGARWMVGHMKRDDRGVQRFARLLAELRTSGGLGEILQVAMRDFCAVYGVA